MTRGSAILTAAACFAVAACQARPSGVAPGPARTVAPGRTSALRPVAVTPATTFVAPEQPHASEGALPALALHVPRAPHAIVPSTRFDVPTWGSAVSTHTLLDEHGNGAVPVSEARFLWRDGYLYLLFYAGDLDLQIHTTRRDGPVWKDDSFTLAFVEPDGNKRMLAVSATGVVADGICPRDAESLGDPGCDLGWTSGARTAADWDGTINKLGDFDEEWNIQAAIPLRAASASPLAAGSHVPIVLTRCEIAYDGRRACGFWGSSTKPAELVLD